MNGYLIAMIVLICISSIFSLLGSIGLHRFPDVYTRLHAATKTTTFGMIFLALAVVIYAFKRYIDFGQDTQVNDSNQAAFIVLAAHTILALLAILITNPTGAHAIARAARRAGVKPERAVVDEFEEVRK